MKNETKIQDLKGYGDIDLELEFYLNPEGWNIAVCKKGKRDSYYWTSLSSCLDSNTLGLSRMKKEEFESLDSDSYQRITFHNLAWTIDASNLSRTAKLMLDSNITEFALNHQEK